MFDQPGSGLPAAAQTQPKNQTASTGFWDRANLLGDMGGLRTTLADYGIPLSLQDTENLLKRGATMQGVTTATLQIDTQKAFGLSGGVINGSALQIQPDAQFIANRPRRRDEPGRSHDTPAS